MAKVTFKTDLCKGCGLCVEACPKRILAIAKDTINQKGYYPAVMTRTAVLPARSAQPCVLTASSLWKSKE